MAVSRSEGPGPAGPPTTTPDDLLAVLPDMIFRVGRDGVFREFHGGTGELLLPPDAFLGRPARQVLPADLADLLLAAGERAHRSGRLQLVEYELPPGSGKHFEARVVRGSSGEDAVYVVRDVTEQRRAQARLAESQRERAGLEERLTRQDRLAALGRLAAGVAHDLNNPLTWVRGGLDQVAEGLRAAGLPAAEAAPLLEALEEARGGVERIRRTVQGLQAFAAPQGRPRATLPLARLADRAAALVLHEVRHRARFVRQDEGAPAVHVDEGGLVQLVVSLLLNSAQAIEAGHEAEHEIRVVTRTDGERAVLEVRDTGVGIAPEHLPRIFDPYFTTGGPGAGAGLGLSICHAIAEAHQGTLAVESAPGQGTVVRLTLPAAGTTSPGVAPGPAGAAPGVAAQRVLVVDDEPKVLATAARLLRGEFEVEVAGDGASALERIRAGASYHAILCDLMMPNLTGMEFHAVLARQAPDLARRCAFLTGRAFTDEARRFLATVPDRVLEKPFDVAALRALVRRLADA